MDPLLPKISTYDMDYTTEIQQKMRVPDKISYESDKSFEHGSDDHLPMRNYAVADLVLDSTHRPVKSPGYSPDLLSNTDVRSKTASANDVTRVQRDGAFSASKSPPVRPLPLPSVEASKLEEQMLQLQRRVSSLEWQQNVISTGLTVYVAFRLLRWLLRALE